MRNTLLLLLGLVIWTIEGRIIRMEIPGGIAINVSETYEMLYGVIDILIN